MLTEYLLEIHSEFNMVGSQRYPLRKMTKFLLNHLIEMGKHPLYLTATNFIEGEVHIVQQFIGQIIIHITTIIACHHRYGTQPAEDSQTCPFFCQGSADRAMR